MAHPWDSRAARFARCRLKIEHPVVCGGMTGAGNVDLCVAVSEVGGLGMLTALNFGSPANLKKGIEETRRRTKKPFGVNLTILPAIMPPDYEVRPLRRPSSEG